MADILIRDVRDSDLALVRLFLEEHVETSIFLLSNLAVLGPRLGEHFNSGNFRLVQDRGEVVAVFCLTRRGNLLVQAGGRAELAAPILTSCADQPIPVCGVLGEWPTSEAIWHRLRTDPRLRPTHATRDVLYRLALRTWSPPNHSAAPGVTVRALEPQDFALWEPLNSDYMKELQLPSDNSLRQREEEFVSRARAHLWWGAYVGTRLVSIVGLNATYGDLGQVGGVYTEPASRRSGLSRAAMQRLIEDSRDHHGFECLTLFTAEDNIAARRLYESLGFVEAGAFGLYLAQRDA